MNILHVNKMDKRGGAAVAMWRLHEGLKRVGHCSRLLVAEQTVNDPDVQCIYQQVQPFRTWNDKVVDHIGRRLENRWGFDVWTQRNSWRIPLTPAFREADVINLNNLHGGYFNFRALPELAKAKPVVWSLHDMWPFTGLCAFSYDCDRWRVGCGDCPLLQEPRRQLIEPSPTPVDRTRADWEAKRAIYRSTALHIVTPSVWLRDLARQSILASAATVHHIPFGLDLDLFRPFDRAAAKEALGLPPDAVVLLFTAENGRSPRKGATYLWQALEALPKAESIWLLSSGTTSGAQNGVWRGRTRQLGYLTDERLQRLAFAAADLFVMPSLADNQPLVVTEALACGTPVVAFDAGGIPEMVLHMETGYLARSRDSADLAHGIQLLLKDEALRTRMSHRCREVAEANYDLENQARRYVEVYQQAIECAQTPGRRQS